MTIDQLTCNDHVILSSIVVKVKVNFEIYIAGSIFPIRYINFKINFNFKATTCI